MIADLFIRCYTNHALDQFLEDLMEAGLPGKGIVRLGTRSKSERVSKECVSIKDVGDKNKPTKIEKKTLSDLNRELDDIIYNIKGVAKRANSLSQEYMLRDHLQRHHPLVYKIFYPQAHQDTSERGWTQAGRSRAPNSPEPINRWASARLERGINPKLAMNRLHELGPKLLETVASFRHRVYNNWIDEMRRDLNNQYLTLVKDHIAITKKVKACHKERDRRGLQDMDIIGATTTGLATFSPILRMLKSKVLICEEAAEVLEAHVLTALLPSVQHAILIGDHQQLRPQINNFLELSSESKTGSLYRLDESLFERLARQMPVSQLDTQRRMHPSISELVRQTLYPKLTDYKTTAEYPEVVGMKKRLFWLDHRHPEDSLNNDVNDPNSTSKSNTWEVDMVMGLMKHIQRQGVYRSKRIAVLTPYAGQLRLFQQKMGESFELILDERDEAQLALEAEPVLKINGPTVGKGRLLDSLRIATVDNFQVSPTLCLMMQWLTYRDRAKKQISSSSHWFAVTHLETVVSFEPPIALTFSSVVLAMACTSLETLRQLADSYQCGLKLSRFYATMGILELPLISPALAIQIRKSSSPNPETLHGSPLKVVVNYPAVRISPVAILVTFNVIRTLCTTLSSATTHAAVLASVLTPAQRNALSNARPVRYQSKTFSFLAVTSKRAYPVTKRPLPTASTAVKRSLNFSHAATLSKSTVASNPKTTPAARSARRSFIVDTNVRFHVSTAEMDGVQI